LKEKLLTGKPILFSLSIADGVTLAQSSLDCISGYIMQTMVPASISNQREKLGVTLASKIS